MAPGSASDVSERPTAHTNGAPEAITPPYDCTRCSYEYNFTKCWKRRKVRGPRFEDTRIWFYDMHHARPRVRRMFEAVARVPVGKDRIDAAGRCSDACNEGCNGLPGGGSRSRAKRESPGCRARCDHITLLGYRAPVKILARLGRAGVIPIR
jgi:hypothetical protein